MIELKQYQNEGVDFLVKKNLALLADEMGVGKSAQAIRAIEAIGAKSVIILAPKIARINWFREFEKFQISPHEFSIVTTHEEAEAAGKELNRIVICSYGLADTLTKHLPKDFKFDVLVIDECHFLKSTESNRTADIYGVNGLCRHAKKIWAISGTPAPNHIGEMWAMLFTFGVTKLSYEKFIERYCETKKTKWGANISGTKESMIPEIKAMLKPIMLRRMKEDVMKELPKIYFERVPVEPSEVNLDESETFIGWVFPKDRTDELHQVIAEQARDLESAFKIADKTTNYVEKTQLNFLLTMAKSVSTLRMYTGAQKVKNAAELIRQELKSKAYDKVVIFGIHLDVIKGMRDELKDFGAVMLFGGTQPVIAQRNIDKFQNSPHCKVFIGNIQACGTAINLTAAHNVVFIEQDWVPGNNMQAAMRVHRHGQTKPVYVRSLYLPNTIDEHVNKILMKKTSQLTKIFDEERNEIFS